MACLVAAAVGLWLVVDLVSRAGLWRVAANTRILDVLIRSGVVQLTDMDAGYIAGVPEAELYLRARSPIDWLPMTIAVGLLVVAAAVRAQRFRPLADAHDLHVASNRRLLLGLELEAGARFVPFGRLSGPAGRLVDDGAVRTAALGTVNAYRLVSIVELALFAALSLVLLGGAVWLESLAIAAVLLTTAVWLTRARRPVPAAARLRGAARHSLLPLSRRPGSVAAVAVTLIALPIEEVAAYLVVQALSSEVVILGGLTPTVLLLALVAAKIASLVPLAPGGFGQYEWGFAAALYAQGQGLAESVSVTLAFTVARFAAAAVVLGISRSSARRATADASVGLTADIDRGGNGGPVAVADEGDASLVGAGSVVGHRQPEAGVLLWRLLIAGTVLLAWSLVGRLRQLLVDYWLLESLGFESVFWTNAAMGTVLFAGAALVWGGVVAVAGLRFRPAALPVRAVLAVAVVAAVVAGTRWAGRYETFLLFRHGRSFGRADPVFGRDIGFYVFDLPALKLLVWGLVSALATGLAVAVALIAWGSAQSRRDGLRTWLTVGTGRANDAVVVGGVCLTGMGLALGVWLSRYDLLVKDNYNSSIATGAEALDVAGWLSTANLRWLQAAAVLAATGGVVVAARRGGDSAPTRARRLPATRVLLVGPLAVAVAGSSLVGLRDTTRITPNEPISQLEPLQRHIDATTDAWGMDRVEPRNAEVRAADDPLPNLETVLEHPSVTNAQLWPGSVSWLERLLDPQHVDRLFEEADSEEPDQVFSASIDTFRQQQKLRPYYDFLDVDVVSYPDASGMPRLVTSAVRELPLLEPQPWLAFWGQRFVLFTHGYGLVAAPLAEVTADGAPVYLSAEIPPVATDDALRAQRHAVYYGEGSGTIGFSNIDGLAELDYPTDQGRADVFLPSDVDSGIRLDSLWKRLAFAWGVQEFFDPTDVADLLFSGLITDDTRVHYQRQPLSRVAAAAPFLYLDSDPYAVTVDGGITWLVNGLTTSDRYPYSAYADLGDKSVRRGPFPADVRLVNYAADSVKATVDAYTGAVTLYQMSDEPVVSTWAAAYPELFTPAADMPDAVYSQLQYPPQLFHTQFDDLWIYYHVADPVAFFNQEDLFDDSDEVLGPMLAPGKGITFSIEPYPSVIDTRQYFDGTSAQHQFALSQVFTPEGARNLRAVVTVLQGGDDYGRVAMLQYAKGTFVTGPEQAESIIDQAAEIAQQFGFWNSIGVEVIRGYLTPMIIEGEVIYVEPVFIRSEQNPFPQLARVVVVVRGHAVMGATLEAALRQAWTELE